MTFVKYISIQVVAYGIDMGLFLIVLHSGYLGPIIANVLAKLAAGTIAFIAHRSFTFRVAMTSTLKHQAIRYFLLLALNVPIASAILSLILAWIANPVAAKFIADVVCVVLTYGLSKHFVFIGQNNQLKKKTVFEASK